jgi:hypothetical protein
MTKRTVEKHVDILYIGYTSLGYVKEKIDEMINLYGDDAELQIEQEAYGDGYEVNVYAQVLETDEEYDLRMKQELAHKARQEKRDLEEFERLQAKFGKV